MENDKLTKGKPRGTKGGRKSLYSEPLFKTTVRLSKAHIVTFAQIDSNLSAAIRAVMDDPRLSKAIQKFIQERNQT